jgi:hypothetical protein
MRVVKLPNRVQAGSRAMQADDPRNERGRDTGSGEPCQHQLKDLRHRDLQAVCV